MTKAKDTSRSSAKLQNRLDLAAQCQVLLALAESRVDGDLLESLFGDLKWKSQNEIAAAFGVSNSTIIGSWRRNGMPGEQGNYRVVDIVKWLLNRRIQEQQRQPQQDAIGVRMRQIALRDAEIDIARKEREELLGTGKVITVEDAQNSFMASIFIAKHVLESLPRSVSPLLSVEQETVVAGEIMREVNKSLTILCDASEEITNVVFADLRAGVPLVKIEPKIARWAKDEHRKAAKGERKQRNDAGERVPRRTRRVARKPSTNGSSDAVNNRRSRSGKVSRDGPGAAAGD